MCYFITNSKSGDIPNTHFIAVGQGLRLHFAFNMDAITSHAKSNRRTKEDMQGYIYIHITLLHNEELNDVYSSPNIVWVIKSRRMRWAGCVARMGEERGRIGSWGNRREGDHWGDLGVDGCIILGSPGGGMWVRGLHWTGPG